MLRCSFCEQPLVCKSCKKPVRPRHGEAHVAVYQPDMHVTCPECQKLLACQACGYVYGEQEEDEDEPTP
jgi:hypothetical protein